jgi:hypothetical protein
MIPRNCLCRHSDWLSRLKLHAPQRSTTQPNRLIPDLNCISPHHRQLRIRSYSDTRFVLLGSVKYNMSAIRASLAPRLVRSFTTVPSRPLSSVRDVPITASTIPYQVAPAAKSVLQQAIDAKGPRTNWTKEEISELYNTPLYELHYAAVRSNVGTKIYQS